MDGAVAQLGERVVRNDEVRGSIPLGSTINFSGFSISYPIRPRDARPMQTTLVKLWSRRGSSYGFNPETQKQMASASAMCRTPPSDKNIRP